MSEQHVIDNLEKFDKFLSNKREFLQAMLDIVSDRDSLESIQLQMELLDDIIHHFNVIVKGVVSAGIIPNEE